MYDVGGVGGGPATMHFELGEPPERDAIFFNTGQHPQSDLATRLGCALTRRGNSELRTQT
jgi:hypothetical protein